MRAKIAANSPYFDTDADVRTFPSVDGEILTAEKYIALADDLAALTARLAAFAPALGSPESYGMLPIGTVDPFQTDGTAPTEEFLNIIQAYRIGKFVFIYALCWFSIPGVGNTEATFDIGGFLEDHGLIPAGPGAYPGSSIFNDFAPGAAYLDLATYKIRAQIMSGSIDIERVQASVGIIVE